MAISNRTEKKFDFFQLLEDECVLFGMFRLCLNTSPVWKLVIKKYLEVNNLGMAHESQLQIIFHLM